MLRRSGAWICAGIVSRGRHWSTLPTSRLGSLGRQRGRALCPHGRRRSLCPARRCPVLEPATVAGSRYSTAARGGASNSSAAREYRLPTCTPSLSATRAAGAPGAADNNRNNKKQQQKTTTKNKKTRTADITCAVSGAHPSPLRSNPLDYHATVSPASSVEDDEVAGCGTTHPRNGSGLRASRCVRRSPLHPPLRHAPARRRRSTPRRYAQRSRRRGSRRPRHARRNRRHSARRRRSGRRLHVRRQRPRGSLPHNGAAPHAMPAATRRANTESNDRDNAGVKARRQCDDLLSS